MPFTEVGPELLDAEAALPLFPPRLRRAWRMLGIERLPKLKRLPGVVGIEERCPGGFTKAERRLFS